MNSEYSLVVPDTNTYRYSQNTVSVYMNMYIVYVLYSCILDRLVYIQYTSHSRSGIILYFNS